MSTLSLTLCASTRTGCLSAAISACAEVTLSLAGDLTLSAGTSLALLTPRGTTLAHTILSEQAAPGAPIPLSTLTAQAAEYTHSCRAGDTREALLAIGDSEHPLALVPARIAQNPLYTLAPPTAQAPVYPTAEQLYDLLEDIKAAAAAWQPLSAGTNISIANGTISATNYVATASQTQLGFSAQGYNYGAAVGLYAQGYTYGAAVGFSAQGYNYGAAVGFPAKGNDYGAAVGRSAQGFTYGAAVGSSAQGFNYGAAVGYSAYGDTYGAAVGRNANGANYGAAVGHNAGRSDSGYSPTGLVCLGAYAHVESDNAIAVGRNAKASGIAAIAIGEGTTNPASASLTIAGGEVNGRRMFLRMRTLTAEEASKLGIAEGTPVLEAGYEDLITSEVKANLFPISGDFSTTSPFSEGYGYGDYGTTY